MKINLWKCLKNNFHLRSFYYVVKNCEKLKHINFSFQLPSKGFLHGQSRNHFSNSCSSPRLAKYLCFISFTKLFLVQNSSFFFWCLFYRALITLVCTKFQRQNYRIPWQISPGKIIERKLSIVRVYVYTYKRAFSGRDSCMLHCIIYDPVAWQKPS